MDSAFMAERACVAAVRAPLADTHVLVWRRTSTRRVVVADRDESRTDDAARRLFEWSVTAWLRRRASALGDPLQP